MSSTLSSTVQTFKLLYKSGSRAAPPSKVERFVMIVNGFQSLTIITKCSILDIAAVLDPPLVTDIFWSKFRFQNIYYSKFFLGNFGHFNKFGFCSLSGNKHYVLFLYHSFSYLVFISTRHK